MTKTQQFWALAIGLPTVALMRTGDRVADLHTLAVWLADKDMPAQDRLHVVKHSDEIIAIDRGIIVAILLATARVRERRTSRGPSRWSKASRGATATGLSSSPENRYPSYQVGKHLGHPSS
jgi:hypothetical protein